MIYVLMTLSLASDVDMLVDQKLDLNANPTQDEPSQNLYLFEFADISTQLAP